MQKESSGSVRVFYPRFDKEELTQKLMQKVEELAKRLPLSLVVLFGSYARANYTAASDIDLLVVYRGKEREDAFATVKKVLDIPLVEPHIYYEDEYERQKELISRMITDGVVLFSEL